MTTKQASYVLVLAALIYGGIFPVNRMAAEAGWPSLAFALIPALLGGLGLTALGLFTGKVPSVTGKAIAAHLVMGGLVLGLPIGILARAAQHLPASTLTLVLCLSPVLTLIIATLAGSDRFDRRVLAGMVLGLLGIVLIASPGSGVISGDTLHWFLLSLVAPVLFALSNNCAVWIRPQALSAQEMAAGTLLGGATIAAILAVFTGASLWPEQTGAMQLWPLALSTLINMSFFWLFYRLITVLGPAKFSLFNYLAVAAGVVWSMIIYAEMPTPMFWIAAFLMMVGMHLAIHRPAPR